MDRSGDCWIWTGAVNTHGRCIFKLGDKTEFAQRVSYAHHAKIPSDMQVSIRCGTPRCVRFSHLGLEPGKTQPKRRRDPVPDVVKSRILELHRSGKRYWQIAMITGLSEKTVARVVRKKR